MQKILVVEDETIVQKILSEIAEEKLVRIANVESKLLQYDEITLNPETYEVLKNEDTIDLTKKEYEILKLFMENPRKVFSRNKLLEEIWNYDYAGDERVINTHIMHIRKKLNCNLIDTVRGVGYKLTVKSN